MSFGKQHELKSKSSRIRKALALNPGASSQPAVRERRRGLVHGFNGRKDLFRRTLTPALSHPMGEGVLIDIFERSNAFDCQRHASKNSPSPIGWERAGVRAKTFDFKSRISNLMLRLVLFLPLLLLLSGCVSRKPFIGTRPFDFQQDTFAYPNSLVWDYHFDENGKWVHERHLPKPDYTHHCFVVARSARQFFQNARFDPTQPIADEKTYRRLIRKVVDADPARVLPENERIVIPGYANLRAFSEGQETLLKAECGGAWQSYFQRGHWRIVFPFSRANQNRMAQQLLEDLKQNRPPVVHVIRFPQLSINHALLVFDASETEGAIRFSVYDPNKPAAPKTLLFDRASRMFSFAGNDYWPGGRLDVYEIYRSWNY